MGLRRKFAITVLSLCGGAAAAISTFYALRRRQDVHSQPVTTPTDENLTLKNVQIFFRHGARTPLTNITGLEEVRISTVSFFVCLLERIGYGSVNPRNLFSSSVKDHTHHNLSRSY